ncbi:MAG: AI-2E family transporter [Desulfococcaceae bacterium]
MSTPEKPLALPAPWDRIFPLATRLTVWGLLAGLIYLLRSFFLMVFLTFVFAYIQSTGVYQLRGAIPLRPLRVAIVGALFLGLLTTVGLFVFPNVQRQAESFVRQFSTYVKKVDEVLLDLAHSRTWLRRAIPELESEQSTASPETDSKPEEESRKIFPSRSPTWGFLQELAGFGEKAEGYRNIDQALSLLGSIGGRFASIASAFLLSLLFSFLIVLDMPRLAASLRDLRNTRLHFIYDEVANTIRDFSHVLGQALEAQFFIALLNTLLTAAGIYLLGLGSKVAFLSVIVFFSSFIPVVGVFISSVPICLVALQMPDGLERMMLAILLITIVHVIEGYILNPKIYGSRMRINPVMVLMILTVSGKLFHFWGLILGVPIFTYLFGHAIRYRENANEPFEKPA